MMSVWNESEKEFGIHLGRVLVIPITVNNIQQNIGLFVKSINKRN